MKFIRSFRFLKVPYRSLFGARILVLERLLGLHGYGPERIDQRIRQTIHLKKGFYVEIGANDGILQSNTLILEVYDGWRGVQIEAVPKIFRKLQRNRSSRRNDLFNVACVAFDYPLKTLKLAEANLMSVPLLEGTDIEDPIAHARIGRVNQKGFENHPEPEIIEVPVSTMTDVLRQASAPKTIDFLSLDVEGGELEVLKGIDFDEFSFSWILVESRSPERIQEFLRDQGYVFHAQLSHHDYLFCADGSTCTGPNESQPEFSQ